jgi:hypothetical protein
MSCVDCIFFRAGILCDFCAWSSYVLFDYIACPAFQDSISSHEVNNDVKVEGDAV